MFRHFLFSSLRNLWRQKTYTFITILSLSIGLTVSAFAFLYVKKELGYDRAWPDAERIVRLLVKYEGIPGLVDVEHNSAEARAWPALPDYFAEYIDAATRTVALSIKFSESETNINNSLWFVDPGFAAVFQVQVLEGSLDQVLSGPGYLAVEEDFAQRQDPPLTLGQLVSLENPTVGTPREFEVAAIYRLPHNISPSLTRYLLTRIDDAALPMFNKENTTSSGWNTGSNIWMKLQEGTDLATFNSLQPAFVQEHVTAYTSALGPNQRVSDHFFYRWQKITDMHLNPTVLENRYGAANGKMRVATFAVVGVLVLLAACSNAVGLGLAAALERRREIGIRKAAGAQSSDILVHYMGEAVLLSLLAFLPAIAALELLQPAFYSMFPNIFRVSSVDITGRDYLQLLVIAVLTGCASGSYPGLLLARLHPHAVLRPGAAAGTHSSQRLRSLLVGAQFGVATMLVLATTSLYTQLKVTRAQPLGLELEHRLYFSQSGLPGQGTPEVLRTALAKEPGIEQVISSTTSPILNLPHGILGINLRRESGDFAEIKPDSMDVDAGFAEFFNIQILAGRYFDAALDDIGPLNDPEELSKIERRIVLNRSAARAFGYANPADAVGEQLINPVIMDREGTLRDFRYLVIGVMEDSMFSSLQRRPGPEAHTLIPKNYTSSPLTFVRFQPEVENSIRATIEELSQQILGSPVRFINFFDDQLDVAFSQERNESRLLLICGALALLLACLGLYGLAAFAIERNVKEIGVRKVLGAGVASILRLYLWRFARPVLIAVAVACPIAIYFILRWIEKFPYQLDRAWLPLLCLATCLLVLLIALATVGVITLRAAIAKPLRSLRYE